MTEKFIDIDGHVGRGGDPAVRSISPRSSDDRTMIRVVSLETALERRREFARASLNASLDWRFLNAHRGASDALRLDAAAMRRRGGRMLGENELGCYSSHYAALADLLSSGSQQMIVLEDDVIADWDYLRFIAGHRLSDMGIDYLRLFAKVPGRFRRIQPEFLEPYHHLIQFIGPALGTQAYMVTRNGAERLMQSLRVVSRPIDQALDDVIDHGLPNLAVVPFPIIERFVPSSLGERRFADKPTGAAKLLTMLVQRVEKLRRGATLLTAKPRVGPPLLW